MKTEMVSYCFCYVCEKVVYLYFNGRGDKMNELYHYGIKGMKLGVRKNSYHPLNNNSKRSKKYDPPYSAKEVKEKYGEELFKRLSNDPAHKFRMDTGIELIHKEPTLKELVRIGKNWCLMNGDMKLISDKKSKELYGMTNEEHYRMLIKEYTN